MFSESFTGIKLKLIEEAQWKEHCSSQGTEGHQIYLYGTTGTLVAHRTPVCADTGLTYCTST